MGCGPLTFRAEIFYTGRRNMRAAYMAAILTRIRLTIKSCALYFIRLADRHFYLALRKKLSSSPDLYFGTHTNPLHRFSKKNVYTISNGRTNWL